jgi:hypothetical protein
LKFTYILDLLLPELSGFPIFWLSVHDEGVVRTKLDIYIFLIYSYIPQLHCELPLAVFACFNAVISCAMFFNVASFPLTSAFSCRNMIDKTMCEVLWRNISDFYVNLRVEVRKHVFLSWTRKMSVLIGWPI